MRGCAFTFFPVLLFQEDRDRAAKLAPRDRTVPDANCARVLPILRPDRSHKMRGSCPRARIDNLPECSRENLSARAGRLPRTDREVLRGEFRRESRGLNCRRLAPIRLPCEKWSESARTHSADTAPCFLAERASSPRKTH